MKQILNRVQPVQKVYANGYPYLQQDTIGNPKYDNPDKIRGFVFGKNINVNNVKVDLWEGIYSDVMSKPLSS